MQKQIPETNEKVYKRRIGKASAYSARVQEVMRYDKIPSSVYPIVMSLLNAVLEEHSEEKWQERQARSLKTLLNQSPDPKMAHTDATNRYEQIIATLKDLDLWPW